jgi:hypothetical protein
MLILVLQVIQQIKMLMKKYMSLFNPLEVEKIWIYGYLLQIQITKIIKDLI